MFGDVPPVIGLPGSAGLGAKGFMGPYGLLGDPHGGNEAQLQAEDETLALVAEPPEVALAQLHTELLDRQLILDEELEELGDGTELVDWLLLTL